ncbi:MAG TPA: substrate-binding domain-containing protein [bacterium]|nr:substrate-binding domain-containing protein [bacterium]
MSRERVDNAVRRWRQRAGFSQRELAVRATTSRQTLNAIESGRTVPGTALALRLASVLGARVEDLFHLPETAPEVSARLAWAVPLGDAPVRVRLAASGARTTAVPLTGEWATAAWPGGADGVVCARRGQRVRVRLFESAGRLGETVVVAGCDPALPLIAAHFERRHPQYRLAWLPAGSLRALEWLRDGTASIAGVHLRDARTGQDNVPLVRRTLGDRRVVVLAFATWEQGFILAPGNPRGVHNAGDLGRDDVTIINREPGSGARAVLDAALSAHGVSPAKVRGYARLAPSHLAVAQAVALGLVDVGVGVRAAARAFGLEFVPLQQERYDLVMTPDVASQPAVHALLETIGRAAVRAELGAVGDYDMTRLGTTLACLP